MLFISLSHYVLSFLCKVFCCILSFILGMTGAFVRSLHVYVRGFHTQVVQKRNNNSAAVWFVVIVPSEALTRLFKNSGSSRSFPAPFWSSRVGVHLFLVSRNFDVHI